MRSQEVALLPPLSEVNLPGLEGSMRTLHPAASQSGKRSIHKAELLARRPAASFKENNCIFLLKVYFFFEFSLESAKPYGTQWRPAALPDTHVHSAPSPLLLSHASENRGAALKEGFLTQ